MAFSFLVRRKEPQLLAPSKPTPNETKHLSDLDDQHVLRSHFPIIMYYRNKNQFMAGKDPVKVIKKAVGIALVYYYPYAGRLFKGSNNKIMVDCGSQGILFVEADAAVAVEMLGDRIRPPCQYADEFLLDMPGSQGILGCPLMLIQVTRFICGGFAFAIHLNHIIGDALGLVQFLNAIAVIARGATAPPNLPVWQRDLANARDPPRITCKHQEYEEEVNNNTAATATYEHNFIRRSFFFGPKEIKAIRSQLPYHLQRSSTFDVVSACAWKARTIALNVNPGEIVRLTCVISVRGKNHLDLPDGYYGNALVFPAAISRARSLCNNPVGYTLDLIKKTKSQVTEEYVRSVTDLLVIKGQPPLSESWIVSDTSRVGFGEVDFGWGKPIYGGPLVGAISYSTSVYARFKNSKGEDGMVVPVCLPSEAMERFLEELRKMTQESAKVTSML